MNESDRGKRAERLLEDPVLKQAFKDVEQAIFLKFKTAPMEDREGLHELRLSMHLLDSVVANLERAVSDGKLADYHIAQREKVKSLWPRANKR